jgi:mannosyltransferase OCH1-like enzyme
MYLHQYGGIYMDLDMVCLKPFNDSHFFATEASAISATPRQHHHHADSDGGVFHVTEQFAPDKFRTRAMATNHARRFANAFMAASTRHHVVLNDTLSRLPRRAKRNVLKATGPEFLTKVVNDYLLVVEGDDDSSNTTNNSGVHLSRTSNATRISNTKKSTRAIEIHPMRRFFTMDHEGPDGDPNGGCTSAQDCRQKFPESVILSMWSGTWVQ